MLLRQKNKFFKRKILYSNSFFQNTSFWKMWSKIAPQIDIVAFYMTDIHFIIKKFLYNKYKLIQYLLAKN